MLREVGLFVVYVELPVENTQAEACNWPNWRETLILSGKLSNPSLPLKLAQASLQATMHIAHCIQCSIKMLSTRLGSHHDATNGIATMKSRWFRFLDQNGLGQCNVQRTLRRNLHIKFSTLQCTLYIHCCLDYSNSMNPLEMK